eukprot:g3634.t1
MSTTRGEMNQSNRHTDNEFEALKDDSTGICRKLASLARNLTGAEFCQVEIFESISKASVLFYTDTSISTSSTEQLFTRYRVRQWNPVSCEATWSQNRRVLEPFMQKQISSGSCTVPEEWKTLHEQLGIESILTCPLVMCNIQRQSFWGTITLGHRQNGRFFIRNGTVEPQLVDLINQFTLLAPVQLMKAMSQLTCQLKNSTSIEDQAQLLRDFLIRNTPAISTSLALFDKDCNFADLFVDPNDSGDRDQQQRQLEKQSLRLVRNTAVWNTRLCGNTGEIECNVETRPASRLPDLDFICDKKSENTNSLFILPIREAPHDRNQKPQTQVNSGQPVIGFNTTQYSANTSRWSRYIGAVYFHTRSREDFTDTDKKTTAVLIRNLYHLLQNTLRRSEIQPGVDPSGSGVINPDSSVLSIGSTLPSNITEQMDRFRETNRSRAQNYNGALERLRIQSVLDDSTTNSVVFYGLYDNTPSAIKMMEDSSPSRDRVFRTRLEHSILTTVNHPNIVRLLGSVIQVSGSNVLSTSCVGNSRQVETFLSMKWPRPAPVRSLNWSLFIMEYCGQGTLHNMIHNGYRFHQAHLLWTLLDISKAMEYLHRLGIVHGDLKPANVLIKGSEDDHRGWMCCIADFGSSLRRGSENQTSLGHGCTLAYRAPEIMSLHGLSGHNSFEDRTFADVYSFGMIMYELMERRVPFAGLTGREISDQVREQQRPPLTVIHNHPTKLITLMNQCWAQNARQRPTFVNITTKLRELISEEDFA